jgi:hypothetical protein
VARVVRPQQPVALVSYPKSQPSQRAQTNRRFFGQTAVVVVVPEQQPLAVQPVPLVPSVQQRKPIRTSV